LVYISRFVGLARFLPGHDEVDAAGSFSAPAMDNPAISSSNLSNKSGKR
jgi:hypothetical protein